MFVGRVAEIQQITEFLMKGRASILIVYGRRRIGKTALIEHVIKKRNYLKIEGKQGQPQQAQIQQALFSLAKKLKDPAIAQLNHTTWTQFFDFLANRISQDSLILYFEEVQWLANYEDVLISDLKEAWDNRFSKNADFKLILCGSAPSFMVTKVIRSKALYNRAQYSLPVDSLSLGEVSEFFKFKKSTMEAMDAVLSVGGIPEYLQYLTDESSVYLSLCKNSFTVGGFFADEYEKVFTSSMADNIHYKRTIEFLALKKFAERAQILKHLGTSSGGSMTEVLEDLVLCGFIEEVTPYFSGANKRLVRYAISDPYLQFYFKFIKPVLERNQLGTFKNFQKPLPISSYRQWLGYSFERWCRKNHNKIAKSIGFQDVEYSSGAYFRKEHLGTGFQIDLMFERKDRILTVCEIKYNDSPVTTSIVTHFEQQIEKLKVKKGYTVQKVLIAAGGADPNLRKHFDRIISLEELF